MSSVIESARTLLGLTLPSGAGVGKILMSNGSGVASWQDFIPAGTAMVFYQASAPVGWWTAVALSQYFLMVVTQGSGLGGTAAGSWTPMAPTVGDHSAHTHSVSSGTTNYLPVITGTGNHFQIATDGPAVVNTISGIINSNWQQGNHQHTFGASTSGGPSSTLTHSVGAATHGYAQHKYANIIICTKN
jgi:hypothetical protein